MIKTDDIKVKVKNDKILLKILLSVEDALKLRSDLLAVVMEIKKTERETEDEDRARAA